MNAPELLDLHASTSADVPLDHPNAPTVQRIGLPTFDPQAAAQGQQLSMAHHPLHSIETEVRVSLGEIQMTVSDLLNLRLGQVVSMDHLLDESVDVMVKDQVIARGVLVAVDDCFGVRITEIPVPLHLGQ